MTDISNLLRRLEHGTSTDIECGSGWFGLLLDLDSELSEIDPDYKILQVKEKFGALRFYYSTKTKRARLMDHVIRQYEDLSRKTCEVSGNPGVLMSDGHVYRTFSIEHAPARFKPVHLKISESIDNLVNDDGVAK